MMNYARMHELFEVVMKLDKEDAYDLEDTLVDLFEDFEAHFTGPIPETFHLVFGLYEYGDGHIDALDLTYEEMEFVYLLVSEFTDLDYFKDPEEQNKPELFLEPVNTMKEFDALLKEVLAYDE